MIRKSTAVVSASTAKDHVRHGKPTARKPVRVCIVYEHSLFAHGIKRLLEQQKALRMIGMVERPTVSARDLRRLRPDVVVVEGDGGLALLECLEGLTAVAISLRGDEATIFTGLPIRVSGPEALAEAIRSVARTRTRRRGRRVTP
jgi:DNA-binding NarL/FixJ family response regulator